MNTTPEPAPLPPSVSSTSGLAITCLVLGILAVCSSFLLLGGLLGLIGLSLAVAHFQREHRLGVLAAWGVGLSVLGLLFSVGFGVLYFHAFKHLQSGSSGMTEWEGVAAPDFTVVTLDGKKTTLSELKGKRVVLDFWATWCPPCRMEIPHFIRLVSDTSRNDLIVVGISSEDEKALQDFVKANGINYPIASAKKLPQPYDSIQYIPTTFFIDRHGIIQNVFVGYHELDGLKSHALQKDVEGPPKAQPTVAPKAP